VARGLAGRLRCLLPLPIGTLTPSVLPLQACQPCRACHQYLLSSPILAHTHANLAAPLTSYNHPLPPRFFLPHPPRDKHRGFQLYQSDPSGNYGGWKATAIGANHQAATNVLQGDFKEELSLEEVGGCVGWQHCVVQAVCGVALQIAGKMSLPLGTEKGRRLPSQVQSHSHPSPYLPLEQSLLHP
jgi:hypothetical protein